MGNTFFDNSLKNVKIDYDNILREIAIKKEKNEKLKEKEKENEKENGSDKP